VLSTTDLRLAQRIEKAEALNVVSIAEAVREPGSETALEPFAGGVAVFAGVGSPMTHAVGIGLNGNVATDELERMEDFFFARGSPTIIDLCPLADISVLSFVQNRPYRIVEFNNVMARMIELDSMYTTPKDRDVWEAGSEELNTWARVVSTGFADPMPASDEAIAFIAKGARGMRCWLAGEGSAQAGAAMGIKEGIAVFTGDATLAGARRKGMQVHLINARLAAAQEAGCDLAVTCVLPGSASHRNYERCGFQLLYMRVNVSLDRKPSTA
jgi:GNAT superfamily N-acetyltransferase